MATGLMVTAGANVDPFAKGLSQMTTMSASAGAKIKASLSASAIGLEQQIISAKRAGTAWEGYAAELAVVKAQLAQVNAALATQATEQGAIAAGAVASTGKIRNMTVISRELMVVLREVGRGNWSRVPGSLTLLLGQFFSLKWIMSGFGVALAAVGGAAFLANRQINKLNDALDHMGEAARKGIGDMAKAMESANKKAADAAADLHSWLEKLSQDNVTLAESTDIAVKALHEKYQLMKEASTDKTEQTQRRLEKEEREEELKLLNSAIAQQQKQFASDKAAAIKATVEASTSDEARRREGKLQDAPKELADLDEKIKKAQELRDLVDKAFEADVLKGRVTLQGGYRNQAEYNAAMQGLRDQRAGKEFEVGKKGEEQITSLNKATSELNTLISTRAELQKAEAELTEKQRELAKAAENHREITEKDKESLKQLTLRRDELANSINLHNQYDKNIAGRRGSYGTQHVTERERVGAYGVASPQLEVQKQILREVTKIAARGPKLGSSPTWDAFNTGAMFGPHR
jgi:hypothetical protein